MEEDIVSKESELKSVSREIEVYKVQVRSFDITRNLFFSECRVRFQHLL